MSKSGLAGRSGEFFTLLEELRVFRAGPLAGDPADRALARAARVSPTTIGDWLRGRRFPQDIGQVLAVVRTVQQAASRRGVATSGSGSAGLLDEDRWRAAYRQETQRRAGVVSGGVEQAHAVWALAGPRVRVREVDPRRLGVHAAISAPGVPDEVLPEYVPRDADAGEHGVRAKVAAAAERGGFVLLVGGSSVGKTRCAAEAVKALLPDWWLVHPADSGGIAALAAAPPARMVVWLDELQRYLDGENGLVGGVVRALLDAPGPVVLIATLWPDRYHAYTAVPTPGGPDPRAREREVLELAAVIRISEEFSPAEQDRSRAAAARDRRLALALGAAGYGLTQTLAAAPQLVARWQDARAAHPYGWAVLTAALDVARLGGRAPLSADLLREAAPGYCTSAQQAEAPGDWFEQALAYATKKLHGAAAALSPTGVGVMGQVAGYTVADYLLQHASRERRSTRVPASTWDALLSRIRDPADATRLARSAQHRLQYRYAIPLYRRAANAGDGYAAMRLAERLVERGDLDQAEQILRARADAGDGNAAELLALLLARHGDLDEAEQILRARADAGNAARRLAVLLVERGDWDEAKQILRAHNARLGTPDLTGPLFQREDLDQLRVRADADDGYAAMRLANLLARREDLDQLRARADAGDGYAAERLANLLARRGHLDQAEQILDQAEQILRARADADNGYAAERLADLLSDHGDLHIPKQLLPKQGPRARITITVTVFAAGKLANLLARREDLDQLRARADAGDVFAAGKLANLLAERGDLDQAEQLLRAQANAGAGDALWLAELLTQQGRGEEAERLRRFGLAPDGSTTSG